MKPGEEVTHEAVGLLSDYIKINTSNPPGNEAEAAKFFAEIFDKEGIEYKTYESKPGRVSLRACIKGTGQNKPLILLNHMDVAPAQSEEWSFDPFGGEVKDGFIHGRGALDMKSQGIMELLAFLHISRERITPNRDLIFLAVADEEEGGTWGVKYLLEHHCDDFQAGLVLNEGGFGVIGLIPNSPLMMISTAEKGLCWLKLHVSGPPGHGSMPHGENALEKLIQALNRLTVADQPVTVTPIVAEYFKQLGAAWEFLGPFLKDGQPETLAQIIQGSGLLAMPPISAIVRNTISVTSMNAGAKANVIPTRAEAVLDIRLLPGQDPQKIIEGVKEKLADGNIKIESVSVNRATESPWDTEAFRLIREVLLAHFPQAIVTPSLLFGSSDSRFFRDRGVPTYGVCPILVTMDDARMLHGIDEKISVENLTAGTMVFTDLVRRLVTT
ncbi:MAG: M20/M25/M40 family metallo-hydrolase [Deltaproteobacteria bacterium]|nr:M20/M25/M40 family metallo-hydrolase [Deltaproteobacteria bacterium]